VDRYVEISINNGIPKGYYFRNTESWSNFRTKVIDIELKEGYNTITFSNPQKGGYVDLYKMENIPQEEVWTEIEISDDKAYRYLRYLAPKGSHGNVAEIEFYDEEGNKINGIPFGAEKTEKVDEGYEKAFDGDVTTFYNYKYPDGGYCGIDLGEGNMKKVRKIRFYPRKNYASKMLGGVFQGAIDLQPNSFGFAPYIDKIVIAYPESDIPIEGKTIEIETVEKKFEVKAGEYLQMKAHVQPINAENKEIVWSAINKTGVGEIEPISGRFIAVKPGIVTIVATLKNNPHVSASVEVKIQQ
jgi:hypothetical protein